jgi:sugar lactone lactonase YvrE
MVHAPALAPRQAPACRPSRQSAAPFAANSALVLIAAFVLIPAWAADKSVPAHRGTLSLFAGGLSGQGYRDGAASDARFSYPNGLAFDAAGNLFVADSRNGVIRKITSAGMVSTVAGKAGISGSVDGPAAAAQFSFPNDVAADAAGNIYVADNGNNTIRKIDTRGVVTTLAGLAKQTGSTDAAGAAARFNGASALAIDAAGNLFVADSSNHTIRKVTPTGVVTTFAGQAGKPGSADGTGTAAQFNNPTALTIDSAGNLYVMDAGNYTVRKITAKGLVSTLAGTLGKSGSADGPPGKAQFSAAMGIGCDDAGNIYVADTFAHTIRKIDAKGNVSTLAGAAGASGSVNATGAAARFSLPQRIAVDRMRNLYVTDGNGQIRRITPSGAVTTFAGAPAQSGTADGDALSARFSFSNGVVLDRAGNLFVADMDNGTIRKITPSGVVTTFAGTPGKGGSADGAGAAAQFGGVATLAMDPAGNLYAAEFYNNTVRKVTPAGIVTTFVGTAGKAGGADGKGAAAQLSGPNDIAADSRGNLYIADFYNNTVRKITPDGLVSTLAGSAGKAGSDDGVGVAARFDGPAGVAPDAAGNVYVTELNNHTLRKIAPNGRVTTVAGIAGKPGSADGAGSAARLNGPWGIAIDRHGDIFLCDTGNNAIRKVTPAGIVTTVVGGPGPYWNAPGALPAKLAYPLGITADAKTGDLYVSVPDAVLKVSFE